MKTPLVFLFAAMMNASATDVYIASGEKGVYLTKLDEATGALTEPKLVAELKGSGFLTIHPNNKYLYATAGIKKGDGGVAAFAINADGSLKETGKQSAQGRGLCHISLDSTARSIVGANYGEGHVVSFPVGKNGLLGKLASKHQHEGSSVHARRQKSPHAHSAYVGPDNRFVYAPDLGIDKVMIYQFDPATSKLKAAGHAKSPAGAGPRHMKFGKNGKHAYVLNELSVDISVYDRDAQTGKLTARKVVSTVPDSTAKEGMSCSEIRVSKDGKFIYCANRDLTDKKRDSVSVFSVTDDGGITRIQTIHAAVSIPRNISLAPSGKWLLVAGQKSNNMPVFKVDTATGKLTATTHQVSVPRAMCIEFIARR